MLCDQVRDPGNLGTVIRCADAFGADAVLISRDSVDLYNPKTVRASTGSLFHLPIAVGVDLAEAVALPAPSACRCSAPMQRPRARSTTSLTSELAKPTCGCWAMRPGGYRPSTRAARQAGRPAAVRAGREPQPVDGRRRPALRLRHRAALMTLAI